MQLRTERALTRLQRFSRWVPRRRQWLRCRSAIITVQCSLRMKIAKNIYRAMKLEAKDIGKLQQSNEALKAEIEFLREHSLKLKAETMAKMEHQAVVEKNQEIERLTAEISLLTVENKRLRDEIEVVRSEAKESTLSQRELLEFTEYQEELKREIKQLKDDQAKQQAQLRDVFMSFEVFQNSELATITDLSRHIKIIEAEYRALQYKNMTRVMAEADLPPDDQEALNAANKAVIADLQLEIERLRIENADIRLQLEERPFLEIMRPSSADIGLTSTLTIHL